MKYLLTSSKYTKDTEYFELYDDLAEKVKDAMETTVGQVEFLGVIYLALYVEINTIEDLSRLQELVDDALIFDGLQYMFEGTPSIEIDNDYRE